MLDESTGRLRTEAAVGLTPEEIERGKYALGEGITGNVVATGRARIIPDLRTEPDFLNRTGRLTAETHRTSHQLPVRPDQASKAEPPGPCRLINRSSRDQSLQEDQTFLEIVSAFLAQAIQINRMVMRQKEELLEENAQLRAQVRDRYRFENIIGDSPAMHEVFATVGQVANSRATVLLLGETGTGKEMIAKAIHYNSPRREQAFVRVNCGALTGTLLESELFGHVKGSFTGAIRDKQGRFEAADGGTIFLDEIGTLEPQLQVKLLRVLQEREFERVGDTQTIKVDVRVIAATNVDLQEEVAKGTFREDLFYRLNVVPIYLPPLRNRREDIPRLIDFFLDKYNAAERPQAPANQPGNAQRAAALSLAGKRARTGKRHRAGGRAEQRRGFSRGAAAAERADVRRPAPHQRNPANPSKPSPAAWPTRPSPTTSCARAKFTSS